MSAPPRYAQACDSFQGSPEPGMVDPLIMSADASKHRVGLKKALSARFSKMMGRRKEGQFEDEFVSSENEEVPNIVILNSLTHDQLMELLRAHHETSKYNCTNMQWGLNVCRTAFYELCKFKRLPVLY